LQVQILPRLNYFFKKINKTYWRLAFVADFGKQNFNFKNKFDMENKTSINHENGNDVNRLLPAVLFQDEINAFLKEQFYESWMDAKDWSMFLEELGTQSGVSIQSLSNDLQVGLKNGHSIEKQFELVRTVLKNGR
jgi:hypothetical protein